MTFNPNYKTRAILGKPCDYLRPCLLLNNSVFLSAIVANVRRCMAITSWARDVLKSASEVVASWYQTVTNPTQLLDISRNWHDDKGIFMKKKLLNVMSKKLDVK